MKRQLADVRAFMEAFGQELPEYPTADIGEVRDLRARLISEEAAEFSVACESVTHSGTPGDVDMLDALVDLLYVTYGAALAFGFQDVLQEAWDRVHAANMAKVGGGVRADGKALKPPGWKAPVLTDLVTRPEGDE